MTTAVSHRDSSSPSSTAVVVKYRPATPHWKASLRTTEFTTIANSSRAKAAVSHRPVCRRGTIRGSVPGGGPDVPGLLVTGWDETSGEVTMEGISGGRERGRG
ncbi:hypothetical protein ACIQPS_30350 [Streptomyces sp. NPDC091290]|uniref:hypothetical protein n=1 Tax=Streptomyces sp. NPDC091290 TaxID=3365990 RepID=UPI003806E5BA